MKLQVKAPSFVPTSCKARFIGQDFDVDIPCSLLRGKNREPGKINVRLLPGIKRIEKKEPDRSFGILTFTFSVLDDRATEEVQYDEDVDFTLPAPLDPVGDLL